MTELPLVPAAETDVQGSDPPVRQPSSAPGAAPGEPVSERRKTILIVDEDTQRGELRVARLRVVGVDARHAASTKDAFDRLQEGAYDLVLLDVRQRPDRARPFWNSVRHIKPNQRVAFYVDGGECISWSAPERRRLSTPPSDTPTAHGNTLLGTPAAPRPGSFLDVGQRIRLNRRLAALRSRPVDPNQ